MLFVRQQIDNGPPLLCRNAAVHQLIQNREHFIPPHGAALQKDLADRQHLTVVQVGGIPFDQAVNLFPRIIDDLSRWGLICKKQRRSSISR